MTFLSSEARRVETKVGRMCPPGREKVIRDISAFLLSGLTPWGHLALRPAWPQESLGVEHFDYAPFKPVRNEFLSLFFTGRKEAPKGEIPS